MTTTRDAYESSTKSVVREALSPTRAVSDHPHRRTADEAAGKLEQSGQDTDALAAATLRIHANRTVISKREVRLLSRFTGANPHVALVGVPSLPFEVSDLEALRAIADQITH